MNYLIPLLILIPLASAVAIFLAGQRMKTLVPFGVLAALITLLLSIGLVIQVHLSPIASGAGTIAPRISFAPDAFRFTLPVSVSNHAIEWKLEFGADGISALLVLLTGIVGFLTVILSTRQITHRTAQYIALLLATISMLMGVFLAMDLVSFYVFFEAVLIPLILLIHGWGNGLQPSAASRRFLLFTLAGSIPMVIGLISLAMAPVNGSRPSTISLVELSQYAADSLAVNGIHSTAPHSTWIVLLLLLGFGIKLALLPLHTWLPMTYAAAHPNTTALVAAVVAKLGLYGLIRIVIPLTPASLSVEAQIIVGGLGALAIVYGAMIALSKSNLRHVLAYSSLSHVGFITMGLMSLTSEGLGGATLQMFNHGLITASMFWILAMLEQRRGPISLSLADRGMAAQYPKLAVLLVFFTLAGAGLPGLNGFVGELLTLSGMMRVSGTIVAVAVLGTVLGAWYGLKIVQRLLFGSNGVAVDLHHHPEGNHDLNPLEWGSLAAVAILCLYIGLFPARSMRLFQPDTDRLARVVEPVSKAAHPNMDQLATTSTK
ncbi:MAG: NADH-quinone oxidoreductase subunit M [Planctomycetota bacterium]|jgi:NADH-quinone oxidoreductase subunit M